MVHDLFVSFAERWDMSMSKKNILIYAGVLAVILIVGIVIGAAISGNDEGVSNTEYISEDKNVTASSGTAKTDDNNSATESGKAGSVSSDSNVSGSDTDSKNTSGNDSGNAGGKTGDSTSENTSGNDSGNAGGKTGDSTSENISGNDSGNAGGNPVNNGGSGSGNSAITDGSNGVNGETSGNGSSGSDASDGSAGSKIGESNAGTDNSISGEVNDGKTTSDGTENGKNTTDGTDAGKNTTDGTENGKNTSDGTDSGKNTTDGTDAGKTTADGTGNGKNTSDGSDGDSKENGYVLTYKTDNSWVAGSVNMFGIQFGVSNGSAKTISGWTVVLEIEGLDNVDGWNGTYTISGDKMTIKDAGYNADIYANGTIVIGCNLGVKTSKVNIKSATLNGVNMIIRSGNVDQNNQNNNPVNNGGSGDKNSNDGKSGNGNSGVDTSGGNGSGDKSDNVNVNVADLLKRSEKAVQGDDWLHTDGNRILDKDNKQVWLTGLNWFGYNTGTNTFDGLWNSKLVPTVKAIADHGFNLIRVPISAELINQWAAGEYPRANYNNALNPELNDMNSLEIWDYFLSLAEANGIKVMPDIHSAETNASGHNVNLWYTDKVSINDYYHALEWMAERYKNNDTIIAFDLKNEPHGKPYEGDGAAIWNDSKKNNNWKYVAETAAAKILKINPNVLIMVEGTEIYPMDLKNNSDYHSTNDKEYYFSWWGGNLRAVADYPINLGKYQNKLVYSPHDYGPTVFEQPWFEGEYNYDSLMKDCWHDNWFYIFEKETAPLLIGEWGGFMTEPNITWMTYMRKLIKTYHLNHTFWCLNANSGDTGGLLLDDFNTWDTTKYNFVKEVLWTENGKFVGLDHEIPLGDNGITAKKAKGL